MHRRHFRAALVGALLACRAVLTGMLQRPTVFQNVRRGAYRFRRVARGASAATTAT